jgi:hypothetical protein
MDREMLRARLRCDVLLDILRGGRGRLWGVIAGGFFLLGVKKGISR